jgi:hypothetical protein
MAEALSYCLWAVGILIWLNYAIHIYSYVRSDCEKQIHAEGAETDGSGRAIDKEEAAHQGRDGKVI